MLGGCGVCAKPKPKWIFENEVAAIRSETVGSCAFPPPSLVCKHEVFDQVGLCSGGWQEVIKSCCVLFNAIHLE